MFPSGRALRKRILGRAEAAPEDDPIRRAVAYAWFTVVQRVTAPLPDFTVVMKLRGWLVKPCFRHCGSNFQLGHGVEIAYPTSIDVGNDVFIAKGAWLLGYGGITLEDEAMLGPFTVITSSNHAKENGSWRFGAATQQPVHLARGVWTGAHAVVTPGVHIGEGTAVAAGGVVTKDLPAHVVAGGVPAKVLRSDAAEDARRREAK